MNEILNYLAQFTLWGSIWAFWIFAILSLFMIMIQDEMDGEDSQLRGAQVLILTIVYFWGSIPFSDSYNINTFLIYNLIGFIYSMLRFVLLAIEARQFTQEFKLKLLRKAIKMFYHWMLFWPVSSINWLFGKVIVDIINWLNDKLAFFHRFLFNLIAGK